MTDIVAKAGIFTARVVFKGDKYGMNDVLIHDKDNPLIEFYDNRQDPARFTQYGQFISRYYLNDVLKIEGGLCLEGGIPSWTVIVEELSVIKGALKRQFDEKGVVYGKGGNLTFSITVHAPEGFSPTSQSEIEERVREDFQSLVEKGWNVHVHIDNDVDDEGGQ